MLKPARREAAKPLLNSRSWLSRFKPPKKQSSKFQNAFSQIDRRAGSQAEQLSQAEQWAQAAPKR